MFYIYILYSVLADKYYVGYSPDPLKRLDEHNSYTNKSKYTAKHQPWELMCYFEVSDKKLEVLKVERFIKRQKSKVFLKKIIIEHSNTDFINSIINKAIG